jgi:hypothetical protein
MYDLPALSSCFRQTLTTLLSSLIDQGLIPQVEHLT